MKKPYPYGIPNSKILSENALRALKADVVLADMQIVDYSDLEKVIDHYLATQQSDDPETAFRTIITVFTKISNVHRNISIKTFVGNVKKYYYGQKDQFFSIYTKKFELLEKDKENRRAADIVAAEEIGRGISRGKKRMAEQSIPRDKKKLSEQTTNILEDHELPAASASVSHYNSTAPSSPSLSRFVNPDSDATINIVTVKDAIKEDAKSLHTLFVEGKELEPNLFKRMSIGLSSIIDFGDTDHDSQKSILHEQWDPLCKHLKYVYEAQKYHLPVELKTTWTLISIFCLKHNSTTKAKDYLRQIIETENKKKSSSSETVRILNVFSFMLDLYDENAWIFDDKQKKSEMDFLSVVWSPLFRKMTYIHNNVILVKGGECTNPYTQFMKSILYNNQKKTIGHKIDIRFVVNDSGEEDLDVGALEAANSLPSEKKKICDSAKLLVEAKDIVDLTINNTIHVDDIRALSGTGFQIGGLACHTSSVYLYRPHVYVALPRFSFEIPSDIKTLRGFEDTFENIMTLITEMEEQASLILKSKDFFDGNRRSLRFTSPPLTDDLYTDFSNWISASWYPPVRKDQKKSKIPEDDIFSTTETATATTTSNTASFRYDPNLVDEFGWVQVDGGYYSVEANVLLEKHPLNQEED